MEKELEELFNAMFAAGGVLLHVLYVFIAIFVVFLIVPTETWVTVLLGLFVNKNCCSLVSKLYRITLEPETNTIKFSEKKFILSGDIFIPNFG